ncbi:hypothetical protein D3C81_1809930 [compost metagenome]
MRQVADHAEAATKTLQRQPETKPVQASSQLLEHGLRRQLLFADFQDQAWPQCGVLPKQIVYPLQSVGVGQGRSRQVERKHLIMATQVRQHFFEHQHIQPRHPAKALQPRQKAAGRHCLAFIIVQP